MNHIKHRVLYLRVWRAHTLRNSQPYQLHASTHAHKKCNSSNSTQTDKIPTHKHLCSDQYYHINSIANPHIKRQQTKITGIMQNRNLTYWQFQYWNNHCLPLPLPQPPTLSRHNSTITTQHTTDYIKHSKSDQLQTQVSCQISQPKTKAI